MRRPAGVPAHTKRPYDEMKQIKKDGQNYQDDNSKQIGAECRVDDGSTVNKMFRKHLDGL